MLDRIYWIIYSHFYAFKNNCVKRLLAGVCALSKREVFPLLACCLRYRRRLITVCTRSFFMHPSNNLCLCAGFSLLEVLFALCILSVGLLGFAEAQLLALRNQQDAYLKSVAQIRLFSLAEDAALSRTTPC